MVLTGRAGLAALLGAALVGGLVAAGTPALAALLVVNVAVLALIGFDVARATSPKRRESAVTSARPDKWTPIFCICWD